MSGCECNNAAELRRCRAQIMYGFSYDQNRIGRIVSPRATGDTRRRQFARARLSRGGRQPALHRARRGIAHLRRGRQRVHRLRRLLGTAAARPPSSGDPPRPGMRAHYRHQFRRAHRGRGRTGRGHLRSRALHRDGAPGEFGHRSHHVRHRRGPRIHRPRPDRQVRGLLSRARRFPAGEGRLGRRHPRNRRHRGRPQGVLRHHHCPALQLRRTPWKRPSARMATASPR